MNTARRSWLFAVVAALGVGVALGAPPTAAFLTVDKHTAAVGDVVKLHFETGGAKDAQPAPWPRNQVEWMFVRGGADQENQHNVQPTDARENNVPLKVTHAGVTLIGADQKPQVLEMTAAEFRAFAGQNLELGEAAGKLPEGEARIRVRHIASAKALVRTPAADGRLIPWAIAASKAGQAVEMRPLFDPTAICPESDLPLCYYVNGAKVPGAKIQATNVTTGATVGFVTDRGGAGYFHVAECGVWRVVAQHARPLEGDAKADWELRTATLTFEVTGKGARP